MLTKENWTIKQVYRVQGQLKFKLLSIITEIKHEKLNNQTTQDNRDSSSKGSLINTTLT